MPGYVPPTRQSPSHPSVLAPLTSLILPPHPPVPHFKAHNTTALDNDSVAPSFSAPSGPPGGLPCTLILHRIPYHTCTGVMLGILAPL